MNAIFFEMLSLSFNFDPAANSDEYSRSAIFTLNNDAGIGSLSHFFNSSNTLLVLNSTVFTGTESFLSVSRILLICESNASKSFRMG